MDMLSVSLVVWTWIFNVSILNWSVSAKFLQLGNLCHLKLWSGPFLVQARTGIAGVCNMLTKKLSVCEFFFISLLVHLILILFYGKSSILE